MPAAGLDRPLGLQVTWRAGRDQDRATFAGRELLEARCVRRVQQGARRQVAQQRDTGQHAPTFAQDQHRVEGAETGTAALLADEQAGPPRFARGGPEVGQRLAVEGGPCGSDRGKARQRSARRLAQEDLLVGEGYVQAGSLPAVALSCARSSENGMPLSSRGSGGRPSTRSPTMFLRISSVPPADLRPGR